MFPLLGLSMVMWFCINERRHALALSYDPSSMGFSRQVKKSLQSNTPILGEGQPPQEILQEMMAYSQWLVSQKPKDMALALEARFLKLSERAKIYKSVVAGCVTVTPLLGLLGTVMGMIETFDALAENVLYSQSGGIASGISTALLTTELGLVVSIPGLVVSQWLNRREEQISTALTQIKEMALEQSLSQQQGEGA